MIIPKQTHPGLVNLSSGDQYIEKCLSAKSQKKGTVVTSACPRTRFRSFCCSISRSLFVVWLSILSVVSGCSIYQSSDRKSFNSNPPQAKTSASAAQLSNTQPCVRVADSGSLLLQGLDLIHNSTAWHTVARETHGALTFLWARHEARFGNPREAIFCRFEFTNSQEFAASLNRLPLIAEEFAANLPTARE